MTEEERQKQIVTERGLVFCDDCLAEYTDRPDKGGLIAKNGSPPHKPVAICPECAPKWLHYAAVHGNDWIKERCPPGVAFADFVRAYRGKRVLQ